MHHISDRLTVCEIRGAQAAVLMVDSCFSRWTTQESPRSSEPPQSPEAPRLPEPPQSPEAPRSSEAPWLPEAPWPPEAPLSPHLTPYLRLYVAVRG